MLDVIWGTTDKPVASKQLAESLQAVSANGTLYIGYPIIGSPEGPFMIDALLLSPDKGAVIFILVEGGTLGSYKDMMDEGYNKLSAKLLQNKQLVEGRHMKVSISVVTFAPAVRDLDEISTDAYQVCNRDTLSSFLDSVTWRNQGVYETLVAVIQSITTIRKARKKRQPSKSSSRGAKLKKLEDSIANLDNTQAAAVIETFDGVQRIRGLAGSGKTIVLALKVAYLHAQHPEWKIVVTFNTRSLKGQFEKLITSFTLEQSGEEPDWENVRVMHAWGSPSARGNDGVYSMFCRENGATYYDFRAAKAKFGIGREFDRACENALQEVNKSKRIFDMILVDEAQDFSPHFLVMCYELLNEPKRLVYAYDELQSLTSKALPSPEEIFGKKEDGSPRVEFSTPVQNQPKQDIILEKCYRNSRPVLTTAHALGFGVYRKHGLIQMFDHKELWKEIGYVSERGPISEGGRVILSRTAETSPLFLEDHSSVDDLIEFHLCEDEEEQTKWLVDSIVKNIEEDELDPDDIIVINPDPIKTRDAVGEARKQLLEREIESNLAGVSSSPDIFFEPETVTFTGVFRAKGNEAAMVYVMNAQDTFTAWRGDIARVRNGLFTAITRSKAWVRVCGFGDGMERLSSEFTALKAKNFKLDFRYPTEEERRELNIVNRDMSESERKRIKQKEVDLKGVLESLDSGETLIEDYPEDVVERLRKYLSRGKK